MNAVRPEHPAAKQALRDSVKKLRFALSADEIQEKSRAVTSRLLSYLDGAGTVMVYVSKPPEVDTTGLIDALLARGTRVVVPIIEKETHTLRLSYLENRGMLVESTFHVPEPIGHEIPASPADLDAIVVPMVGFDRSGNRLGYGAGYYDRFLAGCPEIRTVGIAFAGQEVGAVPHEPFDRQMDAIITECETLLCHCGKT
ncbi:5-formyltetrahydrofolate cyclo-ligase [uncultured Methanofollis sp.]|uniref:5-formyltetrahydrofolate cyclo-ligase n=1 Tax=uncultured Methanofollis sp. TaxID=262500 RepID=UPI0026189657|nr:5-formyltetrahydrofolate cyclo-ligase [uncultured Methanofollis sp.]